jgi:Uncharacterized conserved protein
MNKPLLIMTLAMLLALPAAALADDRDKMGGGFQANETGAPAGGGYVGPGTAQVTVAEALKLGDDAWVTLTGKIERQIEHEKYQFSDGTGTITVEIDDKRWRGLTVGPEDTVIISGEVDMDLGRREIEVKRIAKQ